MTPLLWAFAAHVMACVFASALVATLRIPRVRTLRLADKGVRGGERLDYIVARRERHTASTGLAFAFLHVATILLAADALAAFGLARSFVFVLVPVLFVTAWALPLSLSPARIEGVGLALGPLTRVSGALVGRLGNLLVATTERTPSTEPAATDDASTHDDTADVADDDGEDVLDADERAMVQAVFALGETTVREVMVPRPDMTTATTDMPLRQLVNAILSSGHSRLPVRNADADEFTGFVYAKDVMRQLALQPGRERWQGLVRSGYFVPETKRATDLLTELRDMHLHIALVVDEFGAITGLVTIEDVLEEIVGEIVDEHDVEAPLVADLGDGRLRLDARLAVQDLSDMIGVELPHDSWDTVGGLIMGSLGRVPTPGEELTIESVSFTVEKVQGRRIARVVVSTGQAVSEASVQ